MISDIRFPGATAQRSKRVDLANVLSTTAAEAKSLAPKLADHVEGEVLVKLKPGMSLDGQDDFAGDYGAKVEEHIKMGSVMLQNFNGDLMRISLPQGMTTAEAIVAMGKDDRVAYAVTNDRIQTPETHEVPLSPEQLGNAEYPPLQAAPGSYVHVR